MRKIYILIKKGSLLSFLICASRSKAGKKNFNYWFAQDLYSHQKGQWRTKCVGEGFANAQAFAGVAETGVGFAPLVNLSRRGRLRESTQTVRAMDMQVRPAPSGFSRTTFGSLGRSEIAGIAGESAKNPTKLQNRLDKGGKV